MQHLSRRELVGLTVAALAFGAIEHALRELGGGGGFNAVTRFLPYVGYYLAGHLAADRGAERTFATARPVALRRRLAGDRHRQRCAAARVTAGPPTAISSTTT